MNSRVDLVLAKELLEELNTAKTTSGKKFYEETLIDNFSMLGLSQYAIFEILKEYTKNPKKLNNKKKLRFVTLIYSRILTSIWNFTNKNNLLVNTPDIINDKTNCDFRFVKVYSYLRKHQINFAESLHTANILNSIKSRLKHPRNALITEAAIPLIKKSNKFRIELVSISKPLEKFWKLNKKIILEILNERYYEYVNMKKILKKSKIKKIIAMDDMRSSSPLFFAANKLGIKLLVIQHGLLTPYNLGHVHPKIPTKYFPILDKYVVHSPIYENVIRKEKSFLYNNSENDSGWNLFNVKIKRRKKPKPPYNVFISYETSWPDMVEVRTFVKKLNRKEINVYFSIRPDRTPREAIKDYFEGFKPKKIICEINEKTMKDIDVILGSHGSLIYSLMTAKIPIIKVRTSYDFGKTLDDPKLTVLWNPDEDIIRTIEKAINRTENELKQIRESYLGKGNYRHYSKIIEEFLTT